MEPLEWYRVFGPVAAVLGLAVVCAVRPTPLLQFIGLGIVALVGYGMAQDQFSARLSPEYHTVWHNPVRGLTDPTLLGITWGFLGGWWGGAILGTGIGLTATLGPYPVVRPREVVRPLIVYVMAIVAVAALTGVTVDRFANFFDVSLGHPQVQGLSPARRHNLFVVSCYHYASHTTAGAGCVVLCLWVARERYLRTARPVPASPLAVP
jgi:hypothetical protein